MKINALKGVVKSNKLSFLITITRIDNEYSRTVSWKLHITGYPLFFRLLFLMTFKYFLGPLKLFFKDHNEDICCHIEEHTKAI